MGKKRKKNSAEQIVKGMLRAIGQESHVHIQLTGRYAGTHDDLAMIVAVAVRDAVRRAQLPRRGDDPDEPLAPALV